MPVENWNVAIWSDACALIERAERLHRQFFRPSTASPADAYWEPPVDVLENKQEVLIIAALPGVRREDLDIYVDADALVLRGLRAMPSIGRGTIVRRLEVPYGRFERRITLSGAPFRLQRWDFRDGCLSLNLVKQF
jgi:HSP20 family molecular chaperone IbpA